MRHRQHNLSFEEKSCLMKELIRNKKQYDELIEIRITDISLGVKDRVMDAKEFCALEKALNHRGIVIRRKLGISVDGEAMWCPQCNKFYVPPTPTDGNRTTIKPDFAGCREHKGRAEVIV